MSSKNKKQKGGGGSGDRTRDHLFTMRGVQGLFETLAHLQLNKRELKSIYEQFGFLVDSTTVFPLYHLPPDRSTDVRFENLLPRDLWIEVLEFVTELLYIAPKYKGVYTYSLIKEWEGEGEPLTGYNNFNEEKKQLFELAEPAFMPILHLRETCKFFSRLCLELITDIEVSKCDDDEAEDCYEEDFASVEDDFDRIKPFPLKPLSAVLKRPRSLLSFTLKHPCFAHDKLSHQSQSKPSAFSTKIDALLHMLEKAANLEQLTLDFERHYGSGFPRSSFQNQYNEQKGGMSKFIQFSGSALRAVGESCTDLTSLLVSDVNKIEGSWDSPRAFRALETLFFCNVKKVAAPDFSHFESLVSILGFEMNRDWLLALASAPLLSSVEGTADDLNLKHFSEFLKKCKGKAICRSLESFIVNPKYFGATLELDDASAGLMCDTFPLLEVLSFNFEQDQLQPPFLRKLNKMRRLTSLTLREKKGLRFTQEWLNASCKLFPSSLTRLELHVDSSYGYRKREEKIEEAFRNSLPNLTHFKLHNPN